MQVTTRSAPLERCSWKEQLQLNWRLTKISFDHTWSNLGSLQATMQSRVLGMLWNWRLHQKLSLTKYIDWFHHAFGYVNHVCFTDQTSHLLTLWQVKYGSNESTSFVKETCCWKFQVDTTSSFQVMKWSLTVQKFGCSNVMWGEKLFSRCL